MENLLKNLCRARGEIRSGNVHRVPDSVLIALALGIQEAPVRPSEAADWADREAVPLIRELGRRLEGAVRWYMPADIDGAVIDGSGLVMMGFRLDESRGHPIYVRDAVDDVPDCRTALHLLPLVDTEWIAEIHNWSTDEDGRSAATVPRPLKTYADVRRLCAAVSERWTEGGGVAIHEVADQDAAM